jgi:hemoglobin/transferrin/lactoferrin receptor protein
MYKQSLLSASIVLALTSTASAEEYALFDEVVVSATRTEQSKEDVAASIDSFSAEDIDNSLSNDLKDVLINTPGVDATTSGRFGISGFNIRGMDGDRVKVVVDGVQQVTPYNSGGGTQAIYPNTIEVDTLQAIEINKGASSTLYGSNALGGVVVLKTKDPEDFLVTEGDESRFGIKSSYSSSDEQFKNTLTWAMRRGDLETILIGTYAQGHETETYGDGADVEGEDRGISNPADKDMSNILAKVYYQLNEQNRVGLTYERNNQNFEENKLSGNYTSSHPMFGDIVTYDNSTSDDETLREKIGISYELLGNNIAFDTMALNLNFQTTESTNENYALVTDHLGMIGYSGKRTRTRYAEDETVQFDAQFDKVVALSNSTHEITYGLNYVNTDFSLNNVDYFHDNGTSSPGATNVPDAKMDQWGVFAQNNIFLLDEQLVLNVGVRYDAYEANPSTDDGFSTEHKVNEDDAFTGKVGAVYHFNDQLSTFAQIGQGFKAPTVEQLYYEYDKGSDFTPNSDLEAEKSTSYEIGFRGKNEFAQFELVGFFNDYKDFISTEQLPEKTPGKEHFTLVNLDEVEIKGVEFSNMLLLDKMFSAPEGTYTTFSIAYAEGEDKKTSEKLTSVAPLTSVIGLGYDNFEHKFGGLATLKLVASKTDWPTETYDYEDSAGYGVVDITAYYQPMTDLTLRAGLFNAFDKKYWQYDNFTVDSSTSTASYNDRYSEPGRNWGVSLDYQF